MRRLLLMMALSIAAPQALAEPPTSREVEAMTAKSAETAQAALGTLAQLVTEMTAERMGFDSPAQAREARLGLPLADYMVALDELREYSGERDPGALMQPTGELHYPVLVDQATRSAITLAGNDNEWRAVAFGAPALARALSAARERADAAPDESFVLRIPSLNLVFVAHRSANGQVLLTAAQTGGLFGIEEGETAPAAEVLARLQPEALRHQGLPR